MSAGPERSVPRTAAILAGGLGTRLRAVTGDLPKTLAPVRGRPFIAYLLDRLGAAGVEETVLCTGFGAEKVRRALGASHGGMRLAYSEEPHALGTAGALRHALALFPEESVLVANGDTFCEADLGEFTRYHCSRGAEATLLLAEVPDARRFGSVRVDAEGRVLVFEEKSADAGSGWINAGVYLIARDAIAAIPADTPCALEKELFPRLIGHGLYGYKGGRAFIDIGTPEAYAEAERFFGAPA